MEPISVRGRTDTDMLVLFAVKTAQEAAALVSQFVEKATICKIVIVRNGLHPDPDVCAYVVLPRHIARKL